MASAPAPDAIDRTEAFAAIARAAAERPAIGQNGPVGLSNGSGQYIGQVFGETAPGGYQVPFTTPPQHNALLPNGSVRLDGQVYRWAELSSGDGAWVVVVS